MNKKKVLSTLAIVILIAVIAAGVAMADDGQMTIRNVSKTPDKETVDAAFGMMDFYVPAQSSNGELTSIEYYDAEGTLVETRDQAVPLFTFYIDGINVEEHEEDSRIDSSEIMGGASFGTRDAFVAISLDDGETWKRTNVSDSARLTSYTLENGEEFPGDVFIGDFAVAGDKVFAAWISRFCLGGSAAYTIVDDADEHLYPDYFGVAGSQGSVDYTLQGHPEVGEVPYGCVWTSRGQLLPDPDDGTYDVVWTKPERLTSGRRDAHRLEVAGVEDAGFVLVWQEDPLGLRPGTGLGPGEGWSGAIVNAKTDIWYSVIDWDDFDQVCDDPSADECLPEALVDYYADYEDGDTVAKVAEPMLVPVRVTDNNKCMENPNSENYAPYCVLDFPDDYPESPPIDATSDSDRDFCIDTISWETPQDIPQEVCVSDDERPLLGRVGASRPRIGLHGYDSDGDGETDSAWVILGYEETKALGEGTVEDDNTVTSEGDGSEPEAILDIGKNIWYHSFDMFQPDFIQHGNILNQPAMDPLGNETFPPVNTADTEIEYGDYNYDFYETEIARRFSLISQDFDNAGGSGMVAYALLKQGIIKQGGPADIFGQRFVYSATNYVENFNVTVSTTTPDDTTVCNGIVDAQNDGVNDGMVADIGGTIVDGIENPVQCVSVDLLEGGLAIATVLTDADGSFLFQDYGIGEFVVEVTDTFGVLTEAPNPSDPILIEPENPYAFENMVCNEWDFADGSNPFYPDGICLDTPMNISGTTAEECEGGECPLIEAIYTCVDVDGTDVCDFELGEYDRVIEWSMAVENENDQSWENPFDIAKGHRGFADGDFLMVLYAWSPNYKENAVGHDHYNLYVRRSFDGGLTWSTTPAEGEWGGVGTDVYCENFGWGVDNTIEPFCTSYDPGVYEPARNVSQLIGSRETILDPRYSPTADSILTDGGFLYPDDERDPSKFFIVYETGDNTTVVTGEATPLDLFYSRAYNYGDFYDLVEYKKLDDGGTVVDIEEGWDWLEKGDAESGEASIASNPGGKFFYAAWNEALEIGEEEFTDMDAYFRRVMYLHTYDAPPITSILYVSSDWIDLSESEDDEMLLIIGTARDGDHVDGLPHEDIADLVWEHTFEGLTVELDCDDLDDPDDPDADCFHPSDNPKRLNYPVRNLAPGWHSFTFKASDKGGRWSPGASAEVLVANNTYKVFLPISVNPVIVP